MAPQKSADVVLENVNTGIDKQGMDLSKKRKRRDNAAATEVVDALESLRKARKRRHKEVQGSGVAEEKEKEKKNNKRLQPREGSAAPSVSIVEGNIERNPRKERKKKHSPAEDLVLSTDNSKESNQHEVSASEITPVPAAVADEKAPSKKTKRKHSRADVETEPEHDAQEVTSKPRKKKRKHKEEEPAEVDTTSEPTQLRKKKRSSRKNAELPEPSEDSKLSDSARKALQYVYSQVSSHPDWKFNKARQNWLLRNVWDDAMIPETYFASCLKYLAGVQGATRNLLVKSSMTLIHPEPISAEPKTAGTDDHPVADTVGSAVEPSEDEERRRKLKVDRAQAMLVALGVDAKTDE